MTAPQNETDPNGPLTREAVRRIIASRPIFLPDSALDGGGFFNGVTGEKLRSTLPWEWPDRASEWKPDDQP